MHDDSTSTAQWLSTLSEGGVGFKVWDSTIDLEMDRLEPSLTGFENEFVITPLPADRQERKPFDEAALMAELGQPMPGFDDDEIAESSQVELIPKDFNQSVQPHATNQPQTPEEVGPAPHIVPTSSYTWQPSRQAPPFDFQPESVEVKKAPKKQKPVIIIADNYQVVSGLGKGVMCNVFKVKDLKTDKLMVLKLLPKEAWNKSKCLDRFNREAPAIASFEHSNVIPFRSFGFTNDSQPFIVMDYLHGITLARAIGEGLPLTRVVQVFDQLCRGLSITHEQGIPHRDIRPENIMFISKRGDYNLKLVDFGIAKLICEGWEPMKQLASTGEVFGNPPFMSPEECRGERLDARSDIYSLGCVIYCSMTGKPPFAGSSTAEILKKQQSESLPHPSKVKPAICKPSQAGWVTVTDLEYIVMKCLEKNPNDRYQSVQEIILDLDKLRRQISLQQPQQKAVSTLRTAQLKTIEVTAPKPPQKKFNVLGLVILLIAIVASVAALSFFR